MDSVIGYSETQAGLFNNLEDCTVLAFKSVVLTDYYATWNANLICPCNGIHDGGSIPNLPMYGVLNQRNIAGTLPNGYMTQPFRCLQIIASPNGNNNLK